MSRDGIRVQTLVLVAAVLTVLGYGASLVITRDGALLQRPQWAAGVLLLVSGARTSLDALRAARTVVLSQAAALTGAAVAGWYLGAVIVLLSDLSLVANRERLVPFGLMLLASVALAVCGMVAQAWCRIDENGEPPTRDPD